MMSRLPQHIKCKGWFNYSLLVHEAESIFLFNPFRIHKHWKTGINVCTMINFILLYRMAGNFRGVLIFVIFVVDLAVTKISYAIRDR